MTQRKPNPEDFPGTDAATLSDKTLIQFTPPQIWLLIAALISGAIAASAAWYNIGNRMDKLAERIETAAANRWTSEDQREWVRRLEKRNATLIVPDTDEVRRAIRTP